LFAKFLNIFRIPELRNKLLFTIIMLCGYRIGFYVPLPGVDAIHLREMMGSAQNSALGSLSAYLTMFSGGDLGQSTIFGLGIMPYISASIIIQLLSTAIPTLEKLKKEGEPGMRKINEWTRYLAVGVCIVQALMWMWHLVGSPNNLIYHTVRDDYLGIFIPMGIAALTCGSIFLMWLGEQIDHYGIGNGVSLIITAGIISRMPDSIIYLYQKSTLAVQHSADKLGPERLIVLIFCFIFVVAGSIYLTEAQRRIRVQQAKHMRGRRVYGGQTTYLPLRVNHAGVMPIIFASSLMLFPQMFFQWLAQRVLDWDQAARKAADTAAGLAAGTTPSIHTWSLNVAHFFSENFSRSGYFWEVFYCALIFFFSYFWNTVQFQPKEMANQLRDYGSFIPGLRPGKRTADYLEAVMNRITYVGAAFLCVIAIVPTVAGTYLIAGGGQPSTMDQQAAQFLGGTGLLIVISVMLDLVNRIEANLVMRNYSGFMEGGSGGSGSGAKIRRPKGGGGGGGEPVATFDRRDTKGLPS